MNPIIQLLRPNQWSKNLFVILPIFFSGRLADPHLWAPMLLTVIAFCLASSAIYSLNDVMDAKADRTHPVKCRRPVAAGKVSGPAAITLTVVLAIISIAISLSVNLLTCVTIAVYIAINIAYCLGLRRLAILDVMTIAVGFVLRVLAGGVATDTYTSPWIIIMVFFLSLLIGFGKRRDELSATADAPDVVARGSIREYNLPFLNLVLGILTGMTMTAYIMYTLSPSTAQEFDCQYVYVSSVFVTAGLLHYLQLAIVKQNSGDPTEIFLHNRFVQGCILLWIAFFATIIYL